MTLAPKRELRRVAKGGDFLKPKKWEDWTVGDFVAGVFLRAKEVDLYGKPIYEIKVAEKKITGADPTILTGDKAGIMPLYNNGALAYQMDQLEEGDFVKVTYNGMAKTSNGKFKGKPCHNIEVQSDRLLEEDGAEAESADNDLLG